MTNAEIVGRMIGELVYTVGGTIIFLLVAIMVFRKPEIIYKGENSKYKTIIKYLSVFPLFSSISHLIDSIDIIIKLINK